MMLTFSVEYSMKQFLDFSRSKALSSQTNSIVTIHILSFEFVAFDTEPNLVWTPAISHGGSFLRNLIQNFTWYYPFRFQSHICRRYRHKKCVTSMIRALFHRALHGNHSWYERSYSHDRLPVSTFCNFRDISSFSLTNLFLFQKKNLFYAARYPTYI